MPGLGLNLGLGLSPQGATLPWLLPQVVGNGIQYELTAGPKYWLGSGLTAGTNVLETVRASGITLRNSAGVYSTLGNNVAPITDRGLYPNEQFVNLVARLNPTVAQLSLAANVSDAAGFAGQPNSISFAGGVVAAAYQVGIVASSVPFAVGFLVRMLDGNAPVFSGPTTAGAATFSVIVRGANVPTNAIFATHLRDDIWVVRALGTTGTSGGNFGVIQYENNQNRAFEVCAFQCFQSTFLPDALVPGSSDTGGATLEESAITNPNFSTHAATFGFASGMAALARVNLTRLGDPTARRIATFGTAADGAYIEFTTANRFKVVLRKSSADAVTLESGVVGSAGVYDVTATLDPGAYALTVSGGVTGDTDASAETLPAAIANACYIGHKEDTTLHLNGPLERLAVWGV